MRTHKQIIADAGGPEAFHDKLGLRGKVHTVRSWSQRNSIAPAHWAEIAQRRLATLTELSSAVADRRDTRRQNPQAGAGP